MEQPLNKTHLRNRSTSELYRVPSDLKLTLVCFAAQKCLV